MIALKILLLFGSAVAAMASPAVEDEADAPVALDVSEDVLQADDAENADDEDDEAIMYDGDKDGKLLCRL